MNLLLTFGLIVLLAGVAFVGFHYGLDYGLGRWQHLWACRANARKTLLVGTWQGASRDPDGMANTISLTIDEPAIDDERLEEAGVNRVIQSIRLPPIGLAGYALLWRGRPFFALQRPAGKGPAGHPVIKIRSLPESKFFLSR